MVDAPQVYRHSGRFAVSGLILMLLAGIGVALPLSFGVSALSVNTSISSKAVAVLSIGYAMLVGTAVALAGLFGKCRNMWVTLIMGFLVSLIAWYVLWVVFASYLIFEEGMPPLGAVFDLAIHPAVLWELIQEINKTGWFSTLGDSPKGTKLWIYWAFEGAGIALFGTILSGILINRPVFCEVTGKWCRKEENYLRFAPAETATLVDRLIAGDIKTLGELAVSPDAYPCLRLDVNVSESPDGMYTWQVHVVDLKEEGKSEEGDAELTKNFVMSGEQYRWLVDLRAKIRHEPDTKASSPGHFG